MPPEVVFLSQMFCTTGLVQNKLHKEEIHFLKSYLNRVPLLPRMNVWMKFEEGRSRHSRVIERKVLAHLTLVTLTFDPKTPVIIGFLCYQDGCVDQV